MGNVCTTCDQKTGIKLTEDFDLTNPESSITQIKGKKYGLSHQNTLQSHSTTPEVRHIKSSDYTQNNSEIMEQTSTFLVSTNRVAIKTPTRAKISKSVLENLPEESTASGTETMNQLSKLAAKSLQSLTLTAVESVESSYHGVVLGPLLYHQSGDTYTGQLKDGIRHGYGELVTKSGAFYQGFWRGDRFQGKGRLIDKKGNLYEGEFRKGVFHGRGRFIDVAEQTTYIGDFKNHLKSGNGLQLEKSGDMYEGGWRKNMKSGTGEMTSKSIKGTYKGEFKKNFFHGKGTLEYTNGDRYEGEWYKGVMHGEGRFEYSDTGVVYTGQFRRGVFSGLGELALPDGTVSKGLFKNGELDGKAVMVTSAGKEKMGIFQAGKCVKWLS